MSVLKLNDIRRGPKSGRRERLRLALFPGGEALIGRLIALLEAGGFQVMRNGDPHGDAILGSDGEIATNIVEILDNQPAQGNPGDRASNVRPISLSLADAEAAHVRRVLDLCNGNRTKAANALGVARSTLIRKLHEIEVREKHSSES